MAKQERTKVLATLGAIMTVLVVALIVWRHARIVSWWAIGGVGVVWVVANIVLRLKPKTLGKELPVVDLWSIPHYLTGVLFGLFGIGFGWVLGAAVTWECIEVASAVEEYPTNRVADVLLAIAGWITAMLVGGGAFPMT